MEFFKKYKTALILVGVIILVIGLFLLINKKEKTNEIPPQQQVKQLPLKVEAVPVKFKILQESKEVKGANGEVSTQVTNNLKAVFTNDSEETILTFTLEVLLKDTQEVIQMKWKGPINPGEESQQVTGKGPASGNIDDVQILKYKISTANGTYMEYDSELNQYNWS